MKYNKLINICLLIGLVNISDVNAIKLRGDDANPWGDMLEGTDSSDYAKDSPKAYVEVDKPKINYALIQKIKKAEEAEKKLKIVEEGELSKLKEDMNIELFTFSKTLKPSALHKALDLKEKLDTKGHAPKHFRVAVRNLWSKGFKHDAVSNYAFVKDKL